MSRLPIPHIINTIKTKLGFDRAMTAPGEDIVDAVNKQSQQIANVQNGLAYIVGNTNTTGSTLASGTFVYVKGHSTIAEGLRKVTATDGISVNGSITTNNTEDCTDGGLNALNSKITNLVNSYTIGVNIATTDQYRDYTLDFQKTYNTIFGITIRLQTDSVSNDYAGITASVMSYTMTQCVIRVYAKGLTQNRTPGFAVLVFGI